MKFDTIDKRILSILQEDASIHIKEIAARVNLSTTPCWRRIQHLKSTGVITRQVALLNPKKINLGMTAFMLLKTNQHTHAWSEDFYAVIRQIPEIVGFYRVSGDIDYLLRVVVPDIAAFHEVYKKLIESTALHDVSTIFSMEDVHVTTSMPLIYI